jgi:hypothetical protein
MTALARTCSLFVLSSLAAAQLVLAQAAAPAEAPASPATQWTLEQQKAFLKDADIGKIKDTPKGVTRPSRVTLKQGDVTHDAAFQSVDEKKAVANMASRTELNFRDYWGYNIAAHELACLINRCDLVPAAVERNLRGKTGSMVWWVDDVRMDEGERVKQKLPPPKPWMWTRQMQMMRLFTALSADTDRNATNILITGDDWKVVLIDFSRAFRQTKEIKELAAITQVDAEVLAGLRQLTKEAFKAKASRWLIAEEIEAVLVRRDAIVAHLDEQIAKRGEAQVVYPARPPQP